ncbi:MAG TPA: hypothetical protein VHD15_17685 [Hyphomicrobiales bacterium]|nr:hypothetical protein [Hyphomicrobiales bacterium]
MTDIVASRAALTARLVDGDGTTPREQRQAAFAGARLAGPLDALLDKVRLAATRVTDADVAAAKAAGLSEDQLFELVIAAAVGQATTQYESARAALAAATAGD